MKPLRVGVDLTGIWRRPTGIFRYAAEMAKHLLLLPETEPALQYVFFFSNEVHPDFLPFQHAFEAVICPTSNELLSKQFWFPSILPRMHLDVMHYPAFPPPFLHFTGPRTVMTFYDAGPWRYPHAQTLHGRLYFRTLLSHGICTCTHVVTDSKHAKSEIAHIPQFRERKNRIVNRQDQAGEESADEELAVPGLAFASVSQRGCARDQCPQNTGKPSASWGDWLACSPG